MGRVRYAPVDELANGVKSILQGRGYDQGVAIAYNCQDEGAQFVVVPVSDGSTRCFSDRLTEEIERSGSCEGAIFSEITISDPAVYQEAVDILSEALKVRYDETGDDLEWRVGDKIFVRRYVLEPAN